MQGNVLRYGYAQNGSVYADMGCNFPVWDRIERYMPVRSYSYGYQGSEKDEDIASGHFSTYYREGDARIATWWSVDPATDSQPWLSPYSYMNGNPILYNDKMGDFIPPSKDNGYASEANQVVENEVMKPVEDGIKQHEYFEVKDKMINVIFYLGNYQMRKNSDLSAWKTKGHVGHFEVNFPYEDKMSYLSFGFTGNTIVGDKDAGNKSGQDRMKQDLNAIGDLDRPKVIYQIPVTGFQIDNLFTMYSYYAASEDGTRKVDPPYKYQFLPFAGGKRCASSMYFELKRLSVINNDAILNSTFRAFTPNLLHRYFIKSGVVKSWNIEKYDETKVKLFGL